MHVYRVLTTSLRHAQVVLADGSKLQGATGRLSYKDLSGKVCMPVRTCALTRTLTHTRACIHTHTYACTHARTRGVPCGGGGGGGGGGSVCVRARMLVRVYLRMCLSMCLHMHACIRACRRS